MSKYVVKNCPCYWHIGEDDGCSLENLKNCEDDTNCVIKQIVELCKSTCRKRCTNDCLGTRKHCGYGQILNLLEIEEVNE